MSDSCKGTCNDEGLTCRERLWQLWFLVLKGLIKVFKEVPPEQIKPAMVSVAIRFLKDNGVTIKNMRSTPDIGQSLEDTLADLPDFGGEKPQ